MSSQSGLSQEDIDLLAVIRERKLVTEEELSKAQEVQRKESASGFGRPVADVLVDWDLISRHQADVLVKRAATRRRNYPAIDGYFIKCKIGEGGMGTVYEAIQESMDRRVAVKILAPRLGEDRSYIERFYREARACARLNHPNIVQGIDVGEAGNLCYFVMEFIDGPSAKDVLEEKGSLDEAETISIMRQILAALQHAHENGQVHRDVKPDNIMIDAGSGRAKLCDLGLAKMVDSEEGAHSTRLGMTVGTPHYIAPEQAQGLEDLDIRADIYSLGATAYHLLTGNTPFDGTSATVMAKHIHASCPSPWEQNPGLRDGFVYILEKMMAKEPADRYRTPNEAIEDLDRLERRGRVLAERAKNIESTLRSLTRAGSVRAPSLRSDGPPAAGSRKAAAVMILVVSLLAGLLAGLFLLGGDRPPAEGPGSEAPEPPPKSVAEGGSTPSVPVVPKPKAVVAKTPQVTAGAPPSSRQAARNRASELFRQAEAFYLLHADRLGMRSSIIVKFQGALREVPQRTALEKKIQVRLAEVREEGRRLVRDLLRSYENRAMALVAEGKYAEAAALYETISPADRDEYVEVAIGRSINRIVLAPLRDGLRKVSAQANLLVAAGRYKAARAAIRAAAVPDVPAFTPDFEDAVAAIEEAIEERQDAGGAPAEEEPTAGAFPQPPPPKRAAADPRLLFDEQMAAALQPARDASRDFAGAKAKVKALVADGRFAPWVEEANLMAANLDRFRLLIEAAGAALPQHKNKIVNLKEVGWERVVKGRVASVEPDRPTVRRLDGAEIGFEVAKLRVRDLFFLAGEFAGRTEKLRTHIRAAGAWLVEGDVSSARMALGMVRQEGDTDKVYNALRDLVDLMQARVREREAAAKIEQVRAELERAEDRTSVFTAKNALRRLKSQFGRTQAFQAAEDELNALAKSVEARLRAPPPPNAP